MASPRKWLLLGEAFRTLRKMNNKTEKELLRLAGWRNRDEAFYRKVERGERRPSREEVISLVTKGHGKKGVMTVNRFLLKAGHEDLADEETKALRLDLLLDEPPFDATSRAQLPTMGLVAYYTFAGDAKDQSGNENHGVESGAVTYIGGRVTKVGFDGKTGHISVADSPMLRLRTFTLSAWVNPSLVQGGNRIVEKGNSNSYWLDINPEGLALVGFFDGYYHDVHSRQPLKTDSWHLVTGTFDGTSLRLYVNAVRVDSREFELPTAPRLNEEPLFIGWKYQGVDLDRFAGLLAEVRVYNRALSESEIQELFSSLVDPHFR